MSDHIQKQLDKVFEHIEISNREMGGVQADIKNIQTNIAEIKDCLKNLKGRLPIWATSLIAILMGAIGYLSK